MSSWRKYFNTYSGTSGTRSPISGAERGGLMSRKNYNTFLPEVYSGQSNRVDRYYQYEIMDQDPEVNSALDILAEFCTEINADNGTHFNFHFLEQPTDVEIKILKQSLLAWYRLNEFDRRMFRIVRNTLKYGDQFLVRDPETQKLYHAEARSVDKVIVNESEGKKPEQYVFRDLNVNLQALTVTQLYPGNTSNTTYSTTPSVMGATAPRGAPYNFSAGGATGGRFNNTQSQYPIGAEHVVHLSLNEGLDAAWPFGMSILENVFKTFKQKELIEDAVIIYRVQRAPERRVFKIDTGNLPSHLAMQFLERVKNEIYQRRIPSQTGGGTSIADATYNPLCLDLDTKIPLLDGRTLPLREIISEFEAGKENWAYSCNPETGKVVPGVINWAGVTRKNTDVIELTFDNGKTLVCTPDHKIPVFGKGFVEAQYITENDSLIAFNTKNQPISGGKTNDYQQVWDHEQKDWVWTHRMVGDFFRKLGEHQEFNYLTEHTLSSKTVIHHKDSDRFNNDPRNLTFMNKEDHVLYHAAQKKDFWDTMSTEYRNELTTKISNTLKERWINLTEEERLKRLRNIRAAQKKSVWNRKNNPETASSYKEKMGKIRKEYLSNNPKMLKQLQENAKNRVKIKNQPLNLTFDMLQVVADIVRSGKTSKNEVLDACDNNTKLLELVKENNSISLDYKNAQCKIDLTKFGYSKMNRLLTKFGYKNWKHFVKEIENFNHRVVKITKVSNRDTGTITIDGYHCWHDYHTFAIDAGIFVKNSMNEDFFFAQNSDGKGSSVDVLQGGQNLGEIDDLKFFTNKLFRALRIPSSYMPTGPDDSTAAYNDGRVGTALIQELRFNKYCMRLQNLIVPMLDLDFKVFLKNRGINIDTSMFELKFTEPQNFSQFKTVDVDSTRINNFNSVVAMPFVAKRWAMARYLGLSEQEIMDNEEQWRKEHGSAEFKAIGSDLRSVGITPGGMESDMQAQTDLESMPPEGEEGGAPEAGGPGGMPTPEGTSVQSVPPPAAGNI